MNLKAVHYMILALSAAVVACGWVASSFPADAAIANGIGGLCTQLMAILGVLSPSAGANAPSLAPLAPKSAPGVAASVAQATAAGAAALEATVKS